MLTSTNVRLRALAPGQLPNTVARFGHAAFLGLVDTVAPALADALHDHNGRRPFTVSPLHVADRARVNGSIRLREGDGCSMRFTILEADFAGAPLFQAFQSAFLVPQVDATIHLQDVPLAVEEVVTTPRPDGWSAYTSFAELYAQAKAEPVIGLGFLSPTALSIGSSANGKEFELLPIPWLVFDSLCRKWNEFADQPLIDPLDLRAWVDANVRVSEIHNLNTDLLKFDRFALKGFAGSVVYQVKGEDESMTRALNVLADFALYAGVGYRTTWGMGQCRGDR